MNIAEYLKQKRELVNKAIKDLLQREKVHPLSDIYQYCLSEGKRFRPILVMASAEACGLDGEKVMPAALSLELIHNFSLVHDDMPCMDDDEYRRGKLTCHAKFGQTNALLAGDGLLIFAFRVLSDNAYIDGIDSKRVVEALRIISEASGHNGMTGGQVLDMMYQEKEEITPSILEEIHAKKTGALITASVLVGGTLAGASQEEIERLKIYGENIGITYQIIDDILDYGEDKDTISFPAVFGLEESKKRAFESTQKAIESLNIFGKAADPLREIAKFLLNRKK